MKIENHSTKMKPCRRQHDGLILVLSQTDMASTTRTDNTYTQTAHGCTKAHFCVSLSLSLSLSQSHSVSAKKEKKRTTMTVSALPEMLGTCAAHWSGSGGIIPHPLSMVRLGWCIVTGLLSIASKDPCGAYTDCATCTTSRFHHNTNNMIMTNNNNNNNDDDDDGANYLFPSFLQSLYQNDNNSSEYQQQSSRAKDTWFSITDHISWFLSWTYLWPFHHPSCDWCPQDDNGAGSCVSKSNLLEDQCNTSFIPYEFDCPLGPTPYPKDPPTLLPDWMGHLLNNTMAAERLVLTDLCLPGTHDSFTYDLSLTVSDDGMDSLHSIAALLHALSGGMIQLLPGDVEEFARLQAKTQQLTVTQQLDNGIRFLDCRIMLEKGPAVMTDLDNSHDHLLLRHDRKNTQSSLRTGRNSEWRSLHFMQSKKAMDTYWREIRTWLDQHPQEIIILWLSRRGATGDTGNDQYPGVSLEQKADIWSTFVDIFDGLLFNTSDADSIHGTSIAELLRKQYRVIAYTTDYDEFTNQSNLALDARSIQNYFWLDGVTDLNTSMTKYEEYFVHAESNNAHHRNVDGFTLMSMNTAGPTWQLEEAAKLRFLPWTTSPKKCADKMNLPGMDDWCPQTLLDIVQLSSYYGQVQLERVWQSQVTAMNRRDNNDTDAYHHDRYSTLELPMALYLDGLDVNGTLRTGTQLLDGTSRHKKGGHAQHETAAYAYVDTVIAYNTQKACRLLHGPNDQTDQCASFLQVLEERRAMNPLQMWNDAAFGRRVVNMTTPVGSVATERFRQTDMGTIEEWR